MKVHEIMTAHARCVGPDNTLVEAAGLMRELDVGALPVCEDDRLAGMVTDRDLVLRGVANGRDVTTATVRDVMSPGILYAFADQDVEEASRIMEEKQIRRLPVLNREKRLVGIVSLRDLAMTSSPAFSGQTLQEISASAEEHMRGGRTPGSVRREAAALRGGQAPGGPRHVPNGARKTRGSIQKPVTKGRAAAGKSRSTRAGGRTAAQGGRKSASSPKQAGSRQKKSARSATGRSRTKATSARARSR